MWDHPELVLFNDGIPQTALYMNVEKQEKSQFEELEDHLYVRLGIHISDDTIETDNSD